MQGRSRWRGGGGLKEGNHPHRPGEAEAGTTAGRSRVGGGGYARKIATTLHSKEPGKAGAQQEERKPNQTVPKPRAPRAGNHQRPETAVAQREKKKERTGGSSTTNG